MSIDMVRTVTLDHDVYSGLEFLLEFVSLPKQRILSPLKCASFVTVAVHAGYQSGLARSERRSVAKELEHEE